MAESLGLVGLVQLVGILSLSAVLKFHGATKTSARFDFTSLKCFWRPSLDS